MEQTSTQALLSVIIPVYNVAPYLAECLDSILGQSYTALEVLLINDGSTDGSDAICERYAAQDKRIRVLHQANAGQSAARNRGLELATGKYIAFPDSDDILYTDIFRECVEQLEQNDELSLVEYAFALEQQNLGEEKEHSIQDFTSPHSYVETLAKTFGSDIAPSVSNKVFRSTLLQGIKFLEGVKFEDLEYMFRIAAQTQWMRLIPRKGYYYRRHEGADQTTSRVNYLHHLPYLYSNLQHLAEGGLPLEYARAMNTRLVYELHFPPFYDSFTPEYRQKLYEAQRPFYKYARTHPFDAISWKAKLHSLAYLYFPRLFMTIKYNLRKLRGQI